jgi:hypothetical protein
LPQHDPAAIDQSGPPYSAHKIDRSAETAM